MPRRKTPKNSHYPVGLTKIKLRGKFRFRFRRVDQTDIYFPEETNELEAIEAAGIYNAQFRNSKINLLAHSTKAYMLESWLPKIKNRVIEEELNIGKLSDDVFKTFCLDIERLSKSHGRLPACKINLNTVNEFLEQHHGEATANVYNAKLAFLIKVFDYLMDEGAIKSNFAKQKKKKPKPQKERKRLSLDSLNKMINHAEPFLAIAMRLSFQTTHAVNEITRAKYSDCEWFEIPMVDGGLNVYGVIRIHRQKVKNNEASKVAIPITEMIKQIIIDSYSDGIDSPYIVHRKKQRRVSKLAKGLSHETQLRNADISEGFSKLRDCIGLYSDIEKSCRPTFHEIRSLAIHQYDQLGIDPQKRAAHSNPNTTKKYKEGHIEWVEVEPAQLEI